MFDNYKMSQFLTKLSISTMTLRTCLLVTDDLDDHHAISEALSEVSDRTVLLNVLDSQKAQLLLREGSYQPDYVFLDLSMHGIRINTILKSLRGDNGHARIPIVVYGDQEMVDQIENTDDLVFFSKDYEYSQLKEFLKKVFIQ